MENSEKVEEKTIEKIIVEEGAPGNPETRAQLDVPEPEKSEIAEKVAENPEENPRIDSGEWRDVALGKKKRGRPRKNAEISPEKSAEIAAAGFEKKASEIRVTKARGIVAVAELGLLYFARRFEVPEEQIRFSNSERKALQEAIEPLVGVEENDPWSNLLMVAVTVGGPRVAVLAAARAEKQAVAENATQEAEPCLEVA